MSLDEAVRLAAQIQRTEAEVMETDDNTIHAEREEENEENEEDEEDEEVVGRIYIS